MEHNQQQEITILDPEVITQELTKNNITESILLEMEENFLPLTINGVADKKGYEKVSAARKACKKMRNLATNVCELGRKDAIAVQKAWISKERDIVGRIQKVEDYLSAQEKAVDEEKDRIKREKEEAEQKRLHERVAFLMSRGMSFNGVEYGINELKISVVQVKLMDEFTYNGFLAQLEVEWKKEQERLAAIEAERQEGLRLQALQKAEQEKKEKELAEREAALKTEHDRLTAERVAAEKAAQEQAAKLRKEQERIDREKREADDRRWRGRFAQLPSVNLSSDGLAVMYAGVTVVTVESLISLSDEAFEGVKSILTTKVEQDNAKREQERLAAVKLAEEAAAEKARLEAEAKAKADAETRLKAEQEAKAKAARDAALAPDKDKILKVAEALRAIPLPAMGTQEGITAMTEISLQRDKFVEYLNNKANKLN